MPSSPLLPETKLDLRNRFSQIANLYGGGVDKLPLDDREKYVIEHMSDVADSATNPLGGRKWWQEAEDSWQCLAACVELTKAMQSPKPEEYECKLPVHQVCFDASVLPCHVANPVFVGRLMQRAAALCCPGSRPGWRARRQPDAGQGAC